MSRLDEIRAAAAHRVYDGADGWVRAQEDVEFLLFQVQVLEQQSRATYVENWRLSCTAAEVERARSTARRYVGETHVSVCGRSVPIEQCLRHGEDWAQLGGAS